MSNENDLNKSIELRLRQLGELELLKKNHTKQIENSEASQFNHIVKNEVDQKLSDRMMMLDLMNCDEPTLRVINNSLHNGNRHHLYCNCFSCRKCTFCTGIKMSKNKAGCLTHYGLNHKEFIYLFI
jgi:hypothetical protein